MRGGDAPLRKFFTGCTILEISLEYNFLGVYRYTVAVIFLTLVKEIYTTQLMKINTDN